MKRKEAYNLPVGTAIQDHDTKKCGIRPSAEDAKYASSCRFRPMQLDIYNTAPDIEIRELSSISNNHATTDSIPCNCFFIIVVPKGAPYSCQKPSSCVTTCTTEEPVITAQYVHSL